MTDEKFNKAREFVDKMSKLTKQREEFMDYTGIGGTETIFPECIKIHINDGEDGKKIYSGPLSLSKETMSKLIEMIEVDFNNQILELQIAIKDFITTGDCGPAK